MPRPSDDPEVSASHDSPALTATETSLTATFHKVSFVSVWVKVFNCCG